MSEKKILKAFVLLLAVLMAFSSSMAIANTNIKKENINSSASDRSLVWDNVVGVHGADGGVMVSVVRPDGTAYPADDFELTTPQNVNHVFWQGGYFQCELAQGLKDYEWDWRILFWDDCGDGSHPNSELYNITIVNTSITREPWYTWTNASNGRQYWVANYSADLPYSIPFSANTKYWITIQGIGAYPPQACWVRHNNSVGGIKLHEAVIKAALWGYPDWTDLSVLVTDHLPHDLNFQLYDEPINNPPDAPTINGPTHIGVGVEICWTFCSTDPDGDDIRYVIDWGDGSTDETDCYTSGEPIQVCHTYTSQGDYVIRAKAVECTEEELESGWAELPIQVPRLRFVNNLLQQLFSRFPNILKILQYVLEI